LVWAPTRAEALQAARRHDPQVGPEEILPSERALTFLYDLGDPRPGHHAIAVRTTTTSFSIWSARRPAPARGPQADPASVHPTELQLAMIYFPGTSNRRSVWVTRSDVMFGSSTE
jgi:hypothetical protein